MIVIIHNNEHCVEVDPSTICQCTGLKDKNGKLIWENDVVGGVGMIESEAIKFAKKQMQIFGGAMNDFLAVAIKALEEVQQYHEIGTVEECRAAVEKQKAKRADGGRDIEGKDYLICPNCCAIVADGEWTANFCPDCGQALDWSGEE